MAPETRCCDCLVVSWFIEMCAQEFISESSWLRQAIVTAENLKINPYILDWLFEIILIDEFLWYVWEFYAHILGLLHWGLEVERFKIKADKARI